MLDRDDPARLQWIRQEYARHHAWSGLHYGWLGASLRSPTLTLTLTLALTLTITITMTLTLTLTRTRTLIGLEPLLGSPLTSPAHAETL